jgi:hypothetical protein
MTTTTRFLARIGSEYYAGRNVHEDNPTLRFYEGIEKGRSRSTEERAREMMRQAFASIPYDAPEYTIVAATYDGDELLGSFEVATVNA